MEATYFALYVENRWIEDTIWTCLHRFAVELVLVYFCVLYEILRYSNLEIRPLL